MTIGNNELGQCGVDGESVYGEVNTVKRPVGSTHKWSPASVACGRSHTIVSSRPYGATPDEWSFWSCGNNEHGQLGYQTGRLANSELRRIESSVPFVVVATKADFNVAIDMDGAVWGWGDNSSKVFANVTTDEIVPEIRVFYQKINDQERKCPKMNTLRSLS